MTTFIVGDRLPWPDDVPPREALGPFDSGAIYDSSRRHDCVFRKISARGATVRGSLKTAPGASVSVELGTGQRPAATVEWVRGGEAGLAFKQPVDLLALINRSLIAQPAERRTMPRVEIRCPVHLRWAGHWEPATLRNISAKGLQVQGVGLPDADTFLTIAIEGLAVPAGEVVWRKDDLAGIELFEELSWTSLVPWIREMMKKGLQ
ncbi:PilZ domain-containing protein [Sphingomonas piscis]|uniref:PilZ domain-containing protein n=1 Tax=Sphingomonas piscis TaxID=2714943 RepID=A0A6G7YR04_9SPHN|nr:PilZ domain-containing protein [Sphingomonas piscis]QIK79166.1 PilZ domain-containing protein [Sphingomonas piscis]